MYSVKSATTDLNQTTRVAGIPFYAVSAGCKQQTTYEQHPFHIILKVDSILRDSSGSAKDSVTLLDNEERLVSPSSANDVDRLRAMIDNVFSRDEKDALLTAFRALPLYEMGRDTSRLALVGNTSEQYKFVDYSRTYYFNVRRPLVGTASATAKLNGDGTLTEGTAEVTDNTTSTLLGVLPIKEFLTSKLIPVQKGGTQALHFPLYRYRLTVEQLQVQKTATRTFPLEQPCSPKNPIVLNPGNDGYSFTTVIGSKAAAASSTGDTKNAITVTGQIALPQKQ